jgi:hypothetical protein
MWALYPLCAAGTDPQEWDDKSVTGSWKFLEFLLAYSSQLLKDTRKATPRMGNGLIAVAPYPKISVDGCLGEVAKLNHVLNASD